MFTTSDVCTKGFEPCDLRARRCEHAHGMASTDYRSRPPASADHRSETEIWKTLDAGDEWVVPVWGDNRAPLDPPIVIAVCSLSLKTGSSIVDTETAEVRVGSTQGLCSQPASPPPLPPPSSPPHDCPALQQHIDGKLDIPARWSSRRVCSDVPGATTCSDTYYWISNYNIVQLCQVGPYGSCRDGAQYSCPSPPSPPPRLPGGISHKFGLITSSQMPTACLDHFSLATWVCMRRTIRPAACELRPGRSSARSSLIAHPALHRQLQYCAPVSGRARFLDTVARRIRRHGMAVGEHYRQ